MDKDLDVGLELPSGVARASDNVGVARYHVWRSKSSTTGYSQVGTPTGLRFTSGSLARRTTYWFRVRAGDAAGNVGPFSTRVSTRTT